MNTEETKKMIADIEEAGAFAIIVHRHEKTGQICPNHITDIRPLLGIPKDKPLNLKGNNLIQATSEYNGIVGALRGIAQHLQNQMTETLNPNEKE